MLGAFSGSEDDPDSIDIAVTVFCAKSVRMDDELLWAADSADDRLFCAVARVWVAKFED